MWKKMNCPYCLSKRLELKETETLIRIENNLYECLSCGRQLEIRKATKKEFINWVEKHGKKI